MVVIGCGTINGNAKCADGDFKQTEKYFNAKV